jgi:hypothetical protein
MPKGFDSVAQLIEKVSAYDPADRQIVDKFAAYLSLGHGFNNEQAKVAASLLMLTYVYSDAKLVAQSFHEELVGRWESLSETGVKFAMGPARPSYSSTVIGIDLSRDLRFHWWHSELHQGAFRNDLQQRDVRGVYFAVQVDGKMSLLLVTDDGGVMLEKAAVSDQELILGVEPLPKKW